MGSSLSFDDKPRKVVDSLHINESISPCTFRKIKQQELSICQRYAIFATLVWCVHLDGKKVALFYLKFSAEFSELSLLKGTGSG